MRGDGRAKQDLQLAKKEFHEATILIEPLSSKSIGVGAYPTTAPTPEFNITVEPDIGDLLGSSLDRLEAQGSGRYLLIYHFHNFDSSKPCRVTIKRRKAGRS